MFLNLDYLMGDGYTNIDTGFSGSNTPDKKIKQEREMGESERARRCKESKIGRNKGVIVLILVDCVTTGIATGCESIAGTGEETRSDHEWKRKCFKHV